MIKRKRMKKHSCLLFLTLLISLIFITCKTPKDPDPPDLSRIVIDTFGNPGSVAYFDPSGLCTEHNIGTDSYGNDMIVYQYGTGTENSVFLIGQLHGNEIAAGETVAQIEEALKSGSITCSG